MFILNLTQHIATPAQISAGVKDLELEDQKTFQNLLTFNGLPSYEELQFRAAEITRFALKYKAKTVMIGGAPYLMGALERRLKSRAIQPVYAFTKRISFEYTNSEGAVVKNTHFFHEGFVEV